MWCTMLSLLRISVCTTLFLLQISVRTLFLSRIFWSFSCTTFFLLRIFQFARYFCPRPLVDTWTANHLRPHYARQTSFPRASTPERRGSEKPGQSVEFTPTTAPEFSTTQSILSSSGPIPNRHHHAKAVASTGYRIRLGALSPRRACSGGQVGMRRAKLVHASCKN